MSTQNPYEASQFSGHLDAEIHGGGVSPTVVSHLSRTKPWVQLIGILAIIGAVLMVGSALIMMAGGGIMSAAMQTSGGRALPTEMLVLMGAIYLVIGIVYLWLGIKLIGYGSAIGSLRTSRSVQHLELALDHQRSFWKTMGILTLTGIVVFVIFMIGAVIFGATMASNMQQMQKMQNKAKDIESSSSSPVVPNSGEENQDFKTGEDNK